MSEEDEKKISLEEAYALFQRKLEQHYKEEAERLKGDGPQPVKSLADILRERIARGDQPFFAWGDYDEKSKRAWLQTGNC